MKDYSVEFQGDKNAVVLNSELVRIQGVSSIGLDYIKSLHKVRLEIQEAYGSGQMTNKDYVEEWTKNQFDLQEAWGFPMNQNYHRFWEMKGCSCPKMDNSDNYPSGPYSFFQTCEVHSHMFENKLNKN